MLVAAWAQTSTVSPLARRVPKRSGQARAMRSPAQAKAAKAAATPAVPTSPSSSPMVAKIMSVCASGR